MKAVIVAAGRGKRMMPLTDEIPKPLLPIHGTPILEYLLRGLHWAGISEAIIVVRYLGRKIKVAFGDGTALHMRLSYVQQNGPDGTGSALLSAESVTGSEPFMLLWGDILTDPENYRRMISVYKSCPCDHLSCLNWLDDPSTGAAVSIKNDRIIEIEEKPVQGTAKSHWNQAGLFICTTNIFNALHKCGLSDRGEIEFTTGVQKMVDTGNDVRWMPLEGFWSDVGTPEMLAELNADKHIPNLLK